MLRINPVIIIRSYIIFVVSLLYHIRLIRLSTNIHIPIYFTITIAVKVFRTVRLSDFIGYVQTLSYLLQAKLYPREELSENEPREKKQQKLTFLKKYSKTYRFFLHLIMLKS